MLPMIDHVLIAVTDLEAARAEFESLGFNVTSKARHQRFGTANHLCVLQDAYLELIGIEEGHPADPTAIEVLDPCVRRGGGIPMLALSTENAAASHEALRAAGYSSADPITWSRPAHTPDGEQTASFTTLFVRDELLPGFVAFFCHHHTAGLVKRREWQQHENGAMELVGLEQCAPMHGDLIDKRLARLLGPGAVRRDRDRTLAVRLGRHVLVYHPYEDREQRVQVSIAVDSLERMRAFVDCAGASVGRRAIDVRLESVRLASLRFVQRDPEQL